MALFLEGFRDPAGFVEGARAMREAGKPLAVLQAGRSKEAAAAIAAHSGTLAGSDEVVTGLLRQLGAIGVDDLDELFEVAELLGHGRLPSGRRLFVVTDSGGEANLVADHARRWVSSSHAPSPRLVATAAGPVAELLLHRQPDRPVGRRPRLPSRCTRRSCGGAAEEDVDILAVALDKVTPWAGENELELGAGGPARSLAEADGGRRYVSRSSSPSTPPARPSRADPRRRFGRDGVPLLHGLRPALVALAGPAWWRAWRPRSASARGRRNRQPRPYFEDGPDPVGAGQPAGPGRVRHPGRGRASSRPDEDAAVAVADRIGYPVVMKADRWPSPTSRPPAVVVTGVIDVDGVLAAFETLRARTGEAGLDVPGGAGRGTAAGVELICGMRRDPPSARSSCSGWAGL